jgi:hypothetical protein
MPATLTLDRHGHLFADELDDVASGDPVTDVVQETAVATTAWSSHHSGEPVPQVARPLPRIESTVASWTRQGHRCSLT